MPEALPTLRTLEGRHTLLETVNGPSIVALRLVDEAETLVCQRVQDALLTGCRERERALGRSDGLVIRPDIAKVGGEKTRDGSQAPWIVERFSEGLGFAQIAQDTRRGHGHAKTRHSLYEKRYRIDGVYDNLP